MFRKRASLTIRAELLVSDEINITFRIVSGRAKRAEYSMNYAVSPANSGRQIRLKRINRGGVIANGISPHYSGAYPRLAGSTRKPTFGSWLTWTIFVCFYFLSALDGRACVRHSVSHGNRTGDVPAVER